MNGFDFDEMVDRSGTGSLKESVTPAAVSAAGLPSYWGAEFDFPTCPAFSEGVRRLAERGYFPFTLQTEDYDRHVCWWMKNVRSLDIEPGWIVPTLGTIFSVATSIRMCVPEGENIIVIKPGYNRYEQAARRLRRGTVFCSLRYDSASGAYSMDMESLEELMADPANRLLVFSHPNNPTGLVLSEEELKAIDRLSRKYFVTVFSDEIFAEVVRGGVRALSYIDVAEEDSPAVSCTSMGKCMSLGVNHANVLIKNRDLRERFIRQRYSDHYGSMDPMVYAGLLGAYTEEGKDFVDALNELAAENFSNFKSGVEKILPGSLVTPSDATYLAWVNYRGTRMTSAELSDFLGKALFEGTPGEEYYADEFFYRYSLATPPKALRASLWLLEKTAETSGIAF